MIDLTRRDTMRNIAQRPSRTTLHAFSTSCFTIFTTVQVNGEAMVLTKCQDGFSIDRRYATVVSDEAVLISPSQQQPPSLLEVYNSLDDPTPGHLAHASPAVQAALLDILEEDAPEGMSSRLYGFQKVGQTRSACTPLLMWSGSLACGSWLPESSLRKCCLT